MATLILKPPYGTAVQYISVQPPGGRIHLCIVLQDRVCFMFFWATPGVFFAYTSVVDDKELK
jgi:hypothetical protein